MMTKMMNPTVSKHIFASLTVIYHPRDQQGLALAATSKSSVKMTFSMNLVLYLTLKMTEDMLLDTMITILTLNMAHETWHFEQLPLRSSSLHKQKILDFSEQRLVRSVLNFLGSQPKIWHHAQEVEKSAMVAAY